MGQDETFDEERVDRQKLFNYFTESQLRTRKQEDLELLGAYYEHLTGAERRHLRAWLERTAGDRNEPNLPHGMRMEIEVESVVRIREGKGFPVFMSVRLNPQALLEAIGLWDAEIQGSVPPAAPPVQHA